MADVRMLNPVASDEEEDNISGASEKYPSPEGGVDGKRAHKAVPLSAARDSSLEYSSSGMWASADSERSRGSDESVDEFAFDDDSPIAVFGAAMALTAAAEYDEYRDVINTMPLSAARAACAHEKIQLLDPSNQGIRAALLLHYCGPAPSDSGLRKARSARATQMKTRRKKNKQPWDKTRVNQFLQSTVFGATVDGSTSAEEAAEELRLKTQLFGLRHPDTPIRRVYDMLQLSIMLYLAWVLPTRLAFSKVATGTAEITEDILIDISVWIDIFLSFRMYIYDPKTRRLITDTNYLKRQYYRSWFVIDLFSVVPLDQVLFVIGTLLVDTAETDETVILGYKLLEWSVSARLLRLLRLVRLGKIKHLLKIDRVIANIHYLLRRFGIPKLQIASYFRVGFLVVLIFALSHFLSCMWLMLGRHNVLQEQNPMGWMLKAYEQDTINHTKDYVACIGGSFDASVWNAKHGLSCWNGLSSWNAKHGLPGGHGCAPIPKQLPYDVNCSWIKDRLQTLGGQGDGEKVGASESSQYLAAFYFTLVTVASVGFGDIIPDTEGEKLFVIICITAGAFMYAYIVGEFTLLIANLERERTNYDFKMRSVNDLLGYVEAPEQLRVRVQAYYEFKYHNREGQIELVDELPVELQRALVLARYGKLIARVPFFTGLNDRASTEICRRMTSYTVTPGDHIMQAGSFDNELLILSKGSARTAERDAITGAYVEFDAGTFWGELQLLGLEEQRMLSVLASSFSEIAAITPTAIHNVLVTNVQLRYRFEAYGSMRKEIETALASAKHTDVSVDMDELTSQIEARYQEQTLAWEQEQKEIKEEGPVAADDTSVLRAVEMLHAENARRSREVQLRVDQLCRHVDERMEDAAGRMMQINTALASALKIIGDPRTD